MENKYILIHEINNEGIKDEYPDNLKITVEFTGEHISELVTGFKQFARSIGFAEETVQQYIGNNHDTL